MVAQSKKPAKPKKPIKPRRQMPKQGSKTQAILTLTTTTPATNAEIAKSIASSQSLVTRVQQRYGIEPNRLESFKKHKADIMAALQMRMLKYVNADSLKAASINNLAYAMKEFNNIERLERGQSTANVAYDPGNMREQMANLRQLIADSNAIDITEDSNIK